MSGGRALPLALAATLALAGAAGRAQISPGPLAAPHARLEGSSRCLSCHRPEKGVDPSLCLDCHRALAARVRADRGLHAAPELERCERCHSEHNGREFRLVDFGPGGERGFDHARAGWPLTGKHAAAACRDCHRAERVSPAVLAAERELDPARTYLGLSTGCTGCHRDPHRGTMTAGACTDCHDTESWIRVRDFDHAATRYPLDGRHATVACLACHRQDAPAVDSLVFSQFRSRPLPGCAQCHRDPHAGRLGADCARCHTTSEFRAADRSGFDHERTAYPLRDRHRAVTCAKCHPPGRGLRIAGFERCETCHRDVHGGQLAAAAGGGACARCHRTTGFVPAVYGPEEHRAARFPLAGAHLAVPCSSCHSMIASAALPPPLQRGAPARLARFRFAATACRDCHADPHRGTLDRYVGDDAADGDPAGDVGCRACHVETTWREVRFAHQRTRFPLVGRHTAVACAGCHTRDTRGALALTGPPLDCAGCHRDPHVGQFVLAGAAGTDCARCHSVERFRPASGFDHQTAARYALDGRHLAVPCARCHPSEPAAGSAAPVVRYRPRPLDCAGCHAPAELAGAAAGART